MKKIFIAHRGLWDNDNPENTLKAFQSALNRNLPIEIDIQLTKDNELIVMHDKTLKRTIGINKKVSDLTLKELKQLNIVNSLEHIPTLKEVLNLVNGKVWLDIEIKHYSKSLKTVNKAYKVLKDYKGKYTIKSFNPLIPFAYKKKDSNIACGVLVGSYPQYMPRIIKNFLKNLKYFWLYKPDFVCYNYRELESKIIAKLNNYQIPLHLYTLKTKKDLKQALKVSNTIVFEQIDLKIK